MTVVPRYIPGTMLNLHLVLHYSDEGELDCTSCTTGEVPMHIYSTIDYLFLFHLHGPQHQVCLLAATEMAAQKYWPLQSCWARLHHATQFEAAAT